MSTTEWYDGQKVTLETGDNKQLRVKGRIAARCDYLLHMINSQDGTGLRVPLPDIEMEELVKVMDYCLFHQKADAQKLNEDAIDRWDRRFASMNGALALKVLYAAEYLYNQALVKLLNKTIQEATIGKSDDELYRYVRSGIFMEEELGASSSHQNSGASSSNHRS